MKPEFANQLQEILDKRNNARSTAEDKALKQKEAEATNLSDFRAKCDNTIRPALNEIVAFLTERSVFARVVESPEVESDPQRGGGRDAVIEIDLDAAKSSQQTMSPAFRLLFNKRERKVLVLASSTWKSGPRGSAPLDNVSTDWIHAEFLDYERDAMSML
jgi:hypothetical protein